MSNDSTASESTPLRRSDSQEIIGYNNNNLTPALSTPPQPASANTTISVTANALEQHIVASASNDPTAITTAAANKNIPYPRQPSIAIATSPNTIGSNNNNNNVEVRLGHNFNNNHNYHNNNNNTTSYTPAMDTNKRILCRIGLDVLILLCVGLPILFFYIFGVPYHRGFFCDDESLQHPYKESTVKSWMLYIIGLVIPIAVIIAVEIVRSQQRVRAAPGTQNTRRYGYHSIPDWVVECYKTIGIFGFGVAISQLTTDIAKYSIGRLRPHFFTVCRPVIDDGTSCADSVNIGRYVENYSCSNLDADKRMLKEVGLSFPSGHSSFSFYTMIYLALYLQARMNWRGSKLLRHFLQFVFIMIAWYTALSRVSDYKHHWSDVLAGSAIGATCALVVANFMSDLFTEHANKTYVLPRTTQEATPNTQQYNSYPRMMTTGMPATATPTTTPTPTATNGY